MRALVVYCHPVADSFCAAVRAAAEAGLADGGHEVEVIDLYAEAFRPALDEGERLAHLEPAPDGLDPVLVRHIERLQAAELLVFVYPTWWYGLPAMLKGWIDRVMRIGVAYDLPPGANVITPELRHIRRIAVVTTYGSPWWLIRYVGDHGRRLICRGMHLLCPNAHRPVWLGLYSMDTIGPKERQRFLGRVRRRLSSFAAATERRQSSNDLPDPK